MRHTTVFIVLLMLATFSGCGKDTAQAPADGVPGHIQEYLYETALESVRESYNDPILSTVWFDGRLIELDPSVWIVKLTFTPIDECTFVVLADNQYQIVLTYWANDSENTYTVSRPREPEYHPHPIHEDVF